MNIVAQMCERGHADKMVLSHDTNFYFDALAPPRLVAISAPPSAARQESSKAAV